jgi:tyrosine-protein kinase Etk/Wzc
MLTREPSAAGGDAPPRRPDSLDIHQLWHTVRQGLPLVFGVAIAVFATVMVATLMSRMQFRSVGRLYLGELESSGANAQGSVGQELEISASSQGVVGSEMEIIQSRSLVSRAVLESGMNVAISAVGSKAPRYGQWLLARRDPFLLDTASDELTAKDCLLTDRRAQEQAYTLRFVTDTSYEVWRDDTKLGAGKLGEVVKVPGADLHLLAGKERKPRPGSAYAVAVRPLLEVIDAALKSLQVSAPKPSPQSPPVNVIKLEFTSGSPRQSAAFLERLIAGYLSERQSWKVEDAGAAEAFVAEQLSSVRTSLDDIQRKLASYRSNNRVVVMDNEAKAMIEQIGKYEEQRVAARLEAAALSDVQRTLKGANPPVGAFLLGEANDKVLEGMASTLTAARQKLTDLDSRFNEAAPEVRDQRSQVDAQLEAIRNYVSSRAARAQESLGTLSGIISQYEQRLKTVPGAELGLLQLSRESDVYSRTYQYLLERQQQTAIIKASTLSKNRVLDAPQAPYREDSPKLMLRLASAPLGLLLGVVLVLARSLFAGSFQSEADARAALGATPVLASVPRRLRRRGERKGVVGPGSFDVVGTDTASPFTEAFRTLRTNLYRSRQDGAARALLVTSPTDRDGKTTCALALAAMLAADGKRVLLIDADLRKANQSSYLEPADVPPQGLSDVLRGEEGWGNVVVPITVGLGQFYALASGGDGPPELLSSRRMAELMEDVRKRCDVVLLDAPSFPAASDALVLAELVDTVLSVIRVGSTPRKLAFEHLRALRGRAAAQVVVLNDVGQTAGGKVPRSRRADARPLDDAPQEALAPRLPRTRSLAWWVAGLTLAIVATAVAASMSPRTAELISAAIPFRLAG